MVPEAKLERSEYGLAPTTEGWFVVNVPEAVWVHAEGRGASCVIEGPLDFPSVGYTIAVLQPGEANGKYHRENNQEDFLVLHGECLLLIEGQERRLKAWDFVHCPPDTEHIFVGAGDGPCVIHMAGSRRPDEKIVYPRNEVALRHGASVETETTSPDEAYANESPWQPGPPASFAGTPWA
jgi:uncharacterized cupin superfamily protein